MNRKIKFEHSVIEYMLSVLDSSKENPDCIDMSVPQQPLTEAQKLHIAYELKNFMDEMPGGFFIYHADGDEEIIYANAALLRMFKCNNMEEFKHLTGNTFKGLVHPEDLESVEKSIWMQITDSQYNMDYVEYRIIQKDGEVRWIDDYGHFVHSQSAGDIFYVFVGDATEKKSSFQKKIDEYSSELNDIHKEYLRRLEVIEGLSINYDSILYADLDTNQILPYQLSERTEYQFDKKFQVCDFSWFVSDYVNTWIHPEDKEHVLEVMNPDYIREKLSFGKTFYNNFRVIKDKEILYLQLHIVNVGVNEHISQIIMGFRCVDAEIQQEIEQKKTYEAVLNQAKLANIAKTTFLSNMSHDIRTPMNAIIGFASLAKNHIDDHEKMQDYLDQIQTASCQLLYLVNEMLEISRMESNKVYIDESECSLLEILQEVQNVTRPKALAKGLSFDVDFTGLTHFDICVDSQKLYQILFHLTKNAVSYTNPGGKIIFTAKEDKNHSEDYATYHFIVEDTGIGIDKDFLQRMYEPFERAYNTTLSGVVGTGLGLTLARNLTEIMGGTITAESILGKGSKFTVTISIRLQKHAAFKPVYSEESVVQLLGDRKILLVDDNEINLEIELELLEDIGFVIDTAEDGSIAVEKVMQSQPGYYGLILMDIQMPVMDGHQATKAIRSLENPALASLPIIAVSANAFDEDRKKSMKCGMNGHIAKPVDIALLLEMIAKVVPPVSLT